MKDRVAEAMKGRAEIQAAPDDTARAIQEQRHRSLEARLKDIRLMGDAVIAAFFAEDKPKAREKKRAEVESWLGGSPVAWDKLAAMAATLKQGAHPLTPFHWEIEFPEVFARENGGFDAIVGNPPFLGGKRISTQIGEPYRDWLRSLHPAASSNADLVAHFFLRAYDLIRINGVFGLIATNTISQGDTRETGLMNLLSRGASIANAIRRLKWPGEAAVVVSVIHLIKGAVTSPKLDGRRVERVSAYLVPGHFDVSPAVLADNAGKAFIGSVLLGMGFTFDDKAAQEGVATSIAEMRRLIALNEKNATRIFPYIGGEELNGGPTQRAHRFAIDFGEMSEAEAREGWPDLLFIVQEKVRAEEAVKDLEKRSKKIKTSEEIAQVGSIAANGDKMIGDNATSPERSSSRSSQRSWLSMPRRDASGRGCREFSRLARASTGRGR